VFLDADSIGPAPYESCGRVKARGGGGVYNVLFVTRGRSNALENRNPFFIESCGLGVSFACMYERHARVGIWMMFMDL
jgi:hypothetical protein